MTVAESRLPAVAADAAAGRLARRATRRHYLMTPPTHFEVRYAINAWMDPTVPVDQELALRQWDALAATYAQLGHEVSHAPAVPGLPDMVFAANGGVVFRGIAVGARFATPERAPEAAHYRAALAAAGIDVVHTPVHVNEGEGDYVVVGDTILAGTGFRTDVRAHAELARLTGAEVVTLRLVDPRFYHLDVAVFALDDTTVAWYPDAFDAASRARIQRRFPDAVVATEHDALLFGLNAVSDGRNVVIAREAEQLAADLAARDWHPVPVDLSEFRKAGGGIKCCTLELRPAPEATELRPAPEATELRPAPIERELP